MEAYSAYGPGQPLFPIAGLAPYYREPSSGRTIAHAGDDHAGSVSRVMATNGFPFMYVFSFHPQGGQEIAELD